MVSGLHFGGILQRRTDFLWTKQRRNLGEGKIWSPFITIWFRTAKTRDVSTELFAHLIAYLLAPLSPLTHTLTYSLLALLACSVALIKSQSFIHSHALSLTLELLKK